MKKQRKGEQTQKDTASTMESTKLSGVGRDLIAFMERRGARVKMPPDKSEEEVDAGADAIVRFLALLGPFISPNAQPQTELEAKQERLRQKLASFTFKPPHKTKQ